MLLGCWFTFLLALSLVNGSVDGQCQTDGNSAEQEEDAIFDSPIMGSTFSRDDTMIILSTLEGNLIAVNKRTGQIKWKMEEQPVVKLSKQLIKARNPLFLPDPKDGSLYMLGNGGAESLIKLPFTIPELVAASPSQSSDGMLYMGRKVDTWYVIDPKTGVKQEVLSFKGVEKACPRNKPLGPSIFIGRTEYSLALFDTQTKERRWNVTYFDYTSSALGTQDPQDYDLAHFTTSSTGKVLTLDRHTGDLLWQQDFDSPIVGMYGLIGDVTIHEENMSLINLPFTSLAVETLNNLASRLDKSSEQERRITGDTKLFPTLYVGQNAYGLYAIPSLVDEYTSTFTASHTGRLLIEGPAKNADNIQVSPGKESAMPKSPLNVNIRLPSSMRKEWLEDYKIPGSFNSPKPPIVLFGHYQVPQYSPVRSNDRLQISDATHPPPKVDVGTNTDTGQEASDSGPKTGAQNASNQLPWSVTHVLVTTLAVFFCAIVIPHCRWLMEKSRREELDRGAVIVDRQCPVYKADPTLYSPVIELPSGEVQVGKIQFHPNEILGKGCEGTFVYRGKYDNRDVAVKRLLPDCFMVAEREVELLRESDAHANVIRYFCTEQDRQFKYIALELGVATLQEFVEGKYNGLPIEGTAIMRHATAGLTHLHSLDIVHRDVKPQNVLISAPNAKGEVRAMISDFGLCKKLKIGRMSFSRRSGVAGTEGWIAPEMMTDAIKRTTCAVDVFSLGLVYFYVLTRGKHPFGDVLRRQANILGGEFDLSPVVDNVAACTLIEKMIHSDPLERPPARAILKHPIFWSKEKMLGFFIDTSDRVEKDSTESAVLQSLERAANDVVRGCWKVHIEQTVMQDLRRHRTYQGRSVRDLLRALRNKKNHYREVTEDVRRVMGRTPEEFCDFWTVRFPKLLMHTWYAMHCVKTEHVFSRYYDKQYDFIQKHYVWLSTKPRSIFNRNLDTASPVFDPLYPKSMAKFLSPAADEPANGSSGDADSNDDASNNSADDAAPAQVEEEIPDSWDQRPEEKADESGQVPTHNNTDSATDGSASAEEMSNTNAVGAEKGAEKEDEIVLGPGGQWGRMLDLKPLQPAGYQRSALQSSASAPASAAWKLPSLSQPWTFSDAEHQGRRKKKSRNKKKGVDE